MFRNHPNYWRFVEKWQCLMDSPPPRFNFGQVETHPSPRFDARKGVCCSASSLRPHNRCVPNCETWPPKGHPKKEMNGSLLVGLGVVLTIDVYIYWYRKAKLLSFIIWFIHQPSCRCMKKHKIPQFHPSFTPNLTTIISSWKVRNQLSTIDRSVGHPMVSSMRWLGPETLWLACPGGCWQDRLRCLAEQHPLMFFWIHNQ